MNIIGAVDRNWSIGKNNRLLAQIPIDQKMFRNDTYGKIVIMGRKTFEGLPGPRPLEGRLNIVLSGKEDFNPKGVYVCRSIGETLKVLNKCKARGFSEKDMFVIGGGEVYRQFLPYCDRAYITYIDYEYEADCHMPNLSKDSCWQLSEESEEMTYFDVPFCFRTYERVARKANET